MYGRRRWGRRGRCRCSGLAQALVQTNAHINRASTLVIAHRNNDRILTRIRQDYLPKSSISEENVVRRSRGKGFVFFWLGARIAWSCSWEPTRSWELLLVRVDPREQSIAGVGIVFIHSILRLRRNHLVHIIITDNRITPTLPLTLVKQQLPNPCKVAACTASATCQPPTARTLR